MGEGLFSNSGETLLNFFGHLSPWRRKLASFAYCARFEILRCREIDQHSCLLMRFSPLPNPRPYLPRELKLNLGTVSPPGVELAQLILNTVALRW